MCMIQSCLLNFALNTIQLCLFWKIVNHIFFSKKSFLQKKAYNVMFWEKSIDLFGLIWVAFCLLRLRLSNQKSGFPGLRSRSIPSLSLRNCLTPALPILATNKKIQFFLTFFLVFLPKVKIFGYLNNEDLFFKIQKNGSTKWEIM